MMIGMNPPHSPYASTDDCDLEGMNVTRTKSLTELLVRDNADIDDGRAAAVRYYFANVSGIDRELGRLLRCAGQGRAYGEHDRGLRFRTTATMTSHSTDDPKNSGSGGR